MSSSGSVTCLRTQPTTTNTSDADEQPAAGGEQEVQADVDHRDRRRPAAARAVRSATSAVASLSSDSPSRIVTIRRGSPIRRPIAVAATASGGATTAPIATAPAASRCSGSISVRRRRRRPTVVKTTSPTDSSRIARRLALKSTSEVCTRGGVQQRRQQPEQHDLGLELDLGDAREVRRRDADRRSAAAAPGSRSAPRPRCRRARRRPARPARSAISTGPLCRWPGCAVRRSLRPAGHPEHRVAPAEVARPRACRARARRGCAGGRRRSARARSCRRR